MPAPADLDTRIKFQRRAVDANGDYLGAWTDTGAVTVWGQVTWIRGGETGLASRLEGRQPIAIAVYDTTDLASVDTAWRAVLIDDGNKAFNIRARSPHKDAGFLDILAEGGGADG